LAKVGVKGVDSDLATAIRTVVILIVAWGIALVKGSAENMGGLTKTNWIFLILSGCATACRGYLFQALQIAGVSQVAPVDKLSVALAIVLAVVF